MNAVCCSIRKVINYIKYVPSLLPSGSDVCSVSSMGVLTVHVCSVSSMGVLTVHVCSVSSMGVLTVHVQRCFFVGLCPVLPRAGHV